MEIDAIRSDIDKINDEIFDALIKRLELSKEVAEYKIKQNIPVYSKEREEEILRRIRNKAGVKAEYIIPVFEAILDTSKKLQEDIITGKEGK